MLVKASKRTQVIVATHSEVLVSSLSDHPDSILVFEPGPEGSTVRRLDGEELKPWLEKYSLGDLWANGEIGGVRR
jgi:predicted ATPase